MAYLEDIVARLEGRLGTKLQGTYDGRLKIDYIRFRPSYDNGGRFGNHGMEKTSRFAGNSGAPGSESADKGIIYIGGWNLHEPVPDGCCAIISGGQSQINPGIRELLPDNVLCTEQPLELMAVYETIQDELLSYVQFNEHKEAMFDALQSGSGIRGIIQAAFTFLGNPVIVCDTSFSILENYPEHENVLDFEMRNHKQYMRPASVMSMNKEGIIERIFNDKHAFSVFRKELNMYIMYCSIRIRTNVAGYVCMLEKKRKFTKRDGEFLEVLAQMLSVEMQKSSFFAEKSGLKYEYFLTDLVEGNYVNPEDIHQRMAQLGYQGGRYHWILLLAFEDIYDGHLHNEYLINQLTTIVSGGLAMFYRGNICVLVSSDERRGMDAGEQFKMQEFVALNRMIMAVSYGYDKLNETPAYYDQAEQLLKYGKSRNMQGKIILFEDYCLETVIWSHYKSVRRQTFIHPDLKYLKDYDEKNHTDYLNTLYTYLECNRNAVAAAGKLHIHKSSFFYRFNKICELLEMDAGDCRRLFIYEISMRAGRI